MTTTYKEYMDEKIKFYQKHNEKSDYVIHDSGMENNKYHKITAWEHGAEWTEITELIEVPAIAKAECGIETPVTVKLWKTEYWSTESGSKYLYETA